MQRPRQLHCKHRIRYRVRCRQVKRPRQFLVLHQKENRPHHIAQTDPAHPLPPGSQLSTQPQTKRRQHLLQSTALLAQHHTKAQMHHANPQFLGLLRRRFPCYARLGEKSVSRGALFGQHLVATISVDPNGRGAQQHAGPPPQIRKGFAQSLRARHPTGNNILSIFCRPTATHVRATQMDQRVEPLQFHGMDGELAFARIPVDGARPNEVVPSNQRTNVDRILMSGALERRTDQTRCPAQQNASFALAHHHFPGIQGIQSYLPTLRTIRNLYR